MTDAALDHDHAPVRRPSPLGVLGAGVAGHLAFVVAPAAVHGASAGTISGPAFAVAALIAPVALVMGLWRASPPALLGGVPLGWALPAYGLSAEAFDGMGGAVALAVMLAYAVVALVWLRAARRADGERAAPTWAALDEADRVTERDPLPWLGGVLVAAPALGVALWPPIGEALAVGFPGRTGLAGALVALLGTLVALAMVTDLTRRRPPRRGDAQRAVLLAVVAGLALALWGVLS